MGLSNGDGAPPLPDMMTTVAVNRADDPEIRLMNMLTQIMNMHGSGSNIPHETRRRVALWFHDKYTAKKPNFNEPPF